MKTLLIIIANLITLQVYSQSVKDTNVTSNNNNSVTIIADPRFDLLVNKPNSSNTNGVVRQHKAKGFRVQIYNGNNKQEAIEAKMKFMKTYPGIRSYLSYTSPQYRIRVGDCRSRGEADRLKEHISGTFKVNMIVPDEINVGVTGKSENKDTNNE